MRTKIIDVAKRRFSFSGSFNGAGSGWGLADDIPFRWVRTGMGDYTLTFNPKLYPNTIIANSSVGHAFPVVASSDFGICRINSYGSVGDLEDGVIHFTITTLAPR